MDGGATEPGVPANRVRFHGGGGDYGGASENGSPAETQSMGTSVRKPLNQSATSFMPKSSDSMWPRMIMPLGLPIDVASSAYSAFPPARFTADRQVDVGGEGRHAVSRSEHDSAHWKVRIANGPDCTAPQSQGDVGRQRAERGLWHDIQSWIRSRAVLGPPQRACRSRDERIRAERMGVIVEAPDDDLIVCDESLFRAVRRVLLQDGRVVLVVVERRLVRDHAVLSALDRAAQHVEGRHARGGDASNGSFGISRSELVDRLRTAERRPSSLIPYRR
jgi:hypothetical protein